MSVSLSYETRGPLFTAGRVATELRRAVAEGVNDAGAATVTAVQAELSNVLDNPTGYYRSQITHTLRRDEAEAFIGDDRSVKGPWLEGTSSRNQTSRFRGYSTFRRTMQRMAGRAPGIVDRRVAAAVRRLG